MRNKIELRVLTSGDFSLTRSMLNMFSSAFDAPDLYKADQPGDEYLDQLLSNQNFIAIASSTADTVVGGIVGYILPKIEQARSEFYIYDLAVDEEFRRQGIATALVRAAQMEAMSRGAYLAFVQAHCEDEPAIALYTKLGVGQSVKHFDLKFEAHPS